MRREKAPGPRGMGQVWSWQGQLSRVQWQALGSLGRKLQPLGKGWKNSSRVLGPHLSRLRGIRAGLEVCRATGCWIGKLSQGSCPPCWVNSWVPMQASDSQGDLAIQALGPWAIEFYPSPRGWHYSGCQDTCCPSEWSQTWVVLSLHGHSSLESREEKLGEKR